VRVILPGKEISSALGRHGLVDVVVRRLMTGGGETVTNPQKNGRRG